MSRLRIKTLFVYYKNRTSQGKTLKIHSDSFCSPFFSSHLLLKLNYIKHYIRRWLDSWQSRYKTIVFLNIIADRIV